MFLSTEWGGGGGTGLISKSTSSTIGQFGYHTLNQVQTCALNSPGEVLFCRHLMQDLLNLPCSYRQVPSANHEAVQSLGCGRSIGCGILEMG